MYTLFSATLLVLMCFFGINGCSDTFILDGITLRKDTAQRATNPDSVCPTINGQYVLSEELYRSGDLPNLMQPREFPAERGNETVFEITAPENHQLIFRFADEKGKQVETVTFPPDSTTDVGRVELHCIDNAYVAIEDYPRFISGLVNDHTTRWTIIRTVDSQLQMTTRYQFQTGTIWPFTTTFEGTTTIKFSARK